ncbi:MAG: TolC family protein, partial [Sandaracinus sp.]|nr:TolC family protein [Sandaracinus sp.]
LVQPGWRGRPQGDEGPELQIVVGHTFVLARQGRAVREAAQADRASLDAEVRAALLTHELATADAWLLVWAQDAREQLLEDESVLLETWETRLTRARELGAALESDLAQTRAERAELTSRRLEIERARRDAERSLAEALGRADRVEVEGAPPSWTELPEPPDTLDGFPTVELARARREAEAADLRASLAGLAPQLFVGAQVQTESPDGRMGYAIVQIQGANRAARSIEVARAQTRSARAEVAEEAATREALRLFARAHDEARLADQRLERHLREVAPALEALVDGATRRREQGELTLFEELDHRRRALGARDREIELRLDVARTRARLHLLHDALGRAEGNAR